MDVDDDFSISTSVTKPSTAVTDGQTVAVATGAIPIQPVPMFGLPLVPPIAPIPTLLPSIRPQFAPLPIRPHVLRPSPEQQNGEVSTSDSDSDHDDSGPTPSTAEYLVSEQSRQMRERQEKDVQRLQIKRCAAALAVPINDLVVRALLRRLGVPITPFGEREMERRDRLRMFLAKLDAEGQLERLMKAHEDKEAAASVTRDEAEEDIQYPFYTEGSKAVLQA